MLKNKNKILCMGAINMDLVTKVKDFPRAGETIISDIFENHSGGKGANQAVSAAMLGGNVSFLGSIGKDVYGKILYKSMGEKNINLKGVSVKNNMNTGIAIIIINNNGENQIIYIPGANLGLSEDDIIINNELFAQNDILLLTLELDINLVYNIIKIAKKNDMFVILDPAPSPKESIPDEIFKLIDIIKPNEIEAKFLTGLEIVGKDTIIKSLKILHKLGVKYPIITLGDQGFAALINKEVLFIESVKNLRTLDTTAAGDVFIGALTASISNGNELAQALHFANQSAALSTTVVGAQTSIPTLAQVKNYKFN